MRISVFLPTRNGGALLEDCLRSILDQDAPDFELVVSDNASDDDTPAILESLGGDERLRVLRQPAPIPVTDNWSAALEACTGDYVLMMGDDDYLLPGALSRLRDAAIRHGEPDCLTFEAFGFAFPDALDEGSPAYFSDPLFPFDEEVPAEGELPPSLRRRLVRDFFRFEFRFCPNLQTTLIAKRSLRKMRNGVFREPYPDFYAMHVLLLLADRWVKLADKLVVVGISPKSFGRTLKAGGSADGRRYLGIETEFPGALPGSDMVNGMHRALEKIQEDYRAELDGIEISRANYVYRQVYNWYLAFRMGWIDRRELSRRVRLLTFRDAAGFGGQLVKRFRPGMVRRHARVDEDSAIASVWPNMRPAPDVSSISAFARRVASGRSA